MLAKQFLEPLGITSCRLAKDIKVPLNRITAILRRQTRHHAGHGLLDQSPVAL
jgi:plasmid maintenance system antidote protein VapI